MKYIFGLLAGIWWGMWLTVLGIAIWHHFPEWSVILFMLFVIGMGVTAATAAIAEEV